MGRASCVCDRPCGCGDGVTCRTVAGDESGRCEAWEAGVRKCGGCWRVS